MRPQLAPQGVAGVILPSPPCGEGVACSAPTEPQPFGCLDARRGVGRGAACYALAPPARIINRILCVRTPIAPSVFLRPHIAPHAASPCDSPFARLSPARAPSALRTPHEPRALSAVRLFCPTCPIFPLFACRPHGPRALSAGATKKAACPAGEHAA